MTFLVSDGLYFGEAPFGTLRKDPLCGPAIAKVTQLLLQAVDCVPKRKTRADNSFEAHTSLQGYAATAPARSR